MYNKNAEIYNCGDKIGELASVRLEDMFDDGIAYMCSVNIKAKYNDCQTNFLLVADIDLYIEQYSKKVQTQDGEILKVSECLTDRNDYKFYMLCLYDEDDTLDETRYIASFLDGSKRRFGSASFRTIKDAAVYIKTQKEPNTEKMVWKDSEGKTYSIDDLFNFPTTSIMFHMTLDKYDIYDRNKVCVFSREN